jgi:CRP/FNR family transcriptional regulator, cyclic AMP receptor protein
MAPKGRSRAAASPASPANALDAVSATASVRYEQGDIIFTQGDDCEHIHYIRSGGVMVSAVSPTGAKAVIAMLGPGDFLGEGCLAGQPAYVATAVATRSSAVMPIARDRMSALLHERHTLSDKFLAHVLTRNIRMQEDLTDQIFGASETRLARALLQMAHYGDRKRLVPTLSKVGEAALAAMAGTTAARVQLSLERFERLGFIDYGADARLTINPSLLSVVLRG